jgi:hypothetical protein
MRTIYGIAGLVALACIVLIGLPLTASAEPLPAAPLRALTQTAEPPTQVPPTAEPPTQVPPTAEPPTQVPPTAEPPTQVPPTATLKRHDSSQDDPTATPTEEPTATIAPPSPTAEPPSPTVEPTATATAQARRPARLPRTGEPYGTSGIAGLIVVALAALALGLRTRWARR